MVDLQRAIGDAPGSHAHRGRGALPAPAGRSTTGRYPANWVQVHRHRREGERLGQAERPA